MKIHLTYGIIIGILLSVICYGTYFIYNLNKRVYSQGVAITEVVAFINNQINASQKTVK